MSHRRKEKGGSPFAARMRELRLAARLKPREVASSLEIARSTYAEWEGGTQACSRRDLMALAALYGFRPEDAFPGYDRSEP